MQFGRCDKLIQFLDKRSPDVLFGIASCVPVVNSASVFHWAVEDTDILIQLGISAWRCDSPGRILKSRMLYISQTVGDYQNARKWKS